MMQTLLILLSLSVILLVAKGFRIPVMSLRPHLKQMSTEDSMDAQGEMPARSAFPPRNDFGKMLVSGIIGIDPKETYLSNGHYVINLSLGVSGHFSPIHDWEKSKPNEAMWISTEIWDDEAKNNFNSLKKGAPLCGTGVLMHNKWIDKQSGEERKQFKLRLLKIMSKSRMEEMINSMDKFDSE